MPPGPSLCSYKQAYKAELGSPLQSGGRTFWHRENCGCSSKTFLLAKTSTGHHQVYQILHFLLHFQANHQEASLYTPLPILEKPWESISMDYMSVLLSGLLSTKNGNGCVFAVIDQFLKMPILIVGKKNVTMADIAKLFFKRFWVHFGIP
jgi:hypothetical protein